MMSIPEARRLGTTREILKRQQEWQTVIGRAARAHDFTSWAEAAHWYLAIPRQAPSKTVQEAWLQRELRLCGRHTGEPIIDEAEQLRIAMQVFARLPERVQTNWRRPRAGLPEPDPYAPIEENHTQVVRTASGGRRVNSGRKTNDRISEEVKAHIRDLLRDGLSYPEIAIRVGVSSRTVSRESQKRKQEAA
jgi:hypothetical protein